MQVAERSIATLVSEVRFGITYANLNEALWSHLDSGLNLFQVFAGALAVAGILSDATLVKVAGGMLAAVSAVQLGLSPGKRAVGYRDARMRFHELAGRAWGMELQELDADLERARAAAPPGLRALRKPAWNITAESLGSTERPYELTRLEALLQALAW